MKHLCLHLGLAALAGLLVALPARAQVGTDTTTEAVEANLADTLLTKEVWSNEQPLPGQWQDISVQAEKKSKELRTLGTLFGARPQQVQAHYEGDTLKRLEVTYLEAGNFFGFKKSREANYQKDGPSGQDLKRLERKEERANDPRRAEFKKLFDELERKIPTELEAYCQNPGQRVNIGRNRLLRVRATEFANDVVRFRFMAEDDQLVSLIIIPAAEVSRRLSTQTGSERRGEARESVEKLPNGDVLITNVPMMNQGSRGYCAMGTLAMIMQFYSVNVNIDQLAAAAGYKEGDTDNARIIPIYQAAAKEGRLSMKELRPPLKFREVMGQIAKGRPILMWRYFSRERDDVHRRFLETFTKDPAARLPDPRRVRGEKDSWPDRDSGGHASVITGYNKERDEIIFTESWGENNRNRRMRAEEMEATVYVAFVFEP